MESIAPSLASRDFTLARSPRFNKQQGPKVGVMQCRDEQAETGQITWAVVGPVGLIAM